MATEITELHLPDKIPHRAWRDWATALVPTVASEGVFAWLDAG